MEPGLVAQGANLYGYLIYYAYHGGGDTAVAVTQQAATLTLLRSD